MFSRVHVEAIAALANLDLDGEEVDLFARQLGDILAYVDELQQVDTSSVTATASVVAPLPWDRPDQVQPSLAVAQALANAPEAATAAGLFKVPRVIG